MADPENKPVPEVTPAPTAAEREQLPYRGGVAAFLEGFEDKQPVSPSAAPPPATTPASPATPPNEPLGDAEKTLIERAKKFEAPGSTPSASTPPATRPAAPATPPASTAVAPAATPADVDALLKIPGVADAKLNVDGTEMSMKDFAGQYPEIAQAALIIGKALLRTQQPKTADTENFVTKEAFQEAQNDIRNFETLIQVQQAHPDVLKVVKTPEYADWLGKQPPGVQKMEESQDPADAIALLDAYKEHATRSEASKRREEAKTKKTAKENLHTEMVEGGGRPQAGGTPRNAEDEFIAGFNS